MNIFGLKKWHIICVILFVLFVIPVLLNFFLGIPRLRNVYVVGSSTDWLAFYAAYYGSLITASISFVVLYFSLVESRREHELACDHEEVLEIMRDLSNRFAQFTPSEIIDLGANYTIANSTGQFDYMVSEELSRLQKCDDKYRALKFSAAIMYGSDCEQLNEKCRVFLDSYVELMSEVIQIVENVIVVYSRCGQSDMCSLHAQLEEYSRQIDAVSRKNYEVWKLAMVYVNYRIGEHVYAQHNPLL